MSYIEAEFSLNEDTKQKLRRSKPLFGYNGFGEITYYRSYSRMIYDSVGNVIGQEHWPDTVIRVVEGLFSIRKDHYTKNHILWDEEHWQRYASELAQSMFRMEWLPPGRGLWSMGTDLIRERGAMALYNCSFTTIKDQWISDLCWIMDTLMYGVGVGFRPMRTELELTEPGEGRIYQVADSREGWVTSLLVLLTAFDSGSSLPLFDYSLVRPEGSLISTFGGLASGPGPLKDLHDTIHKLCSHYLHDKESYDEIEFKTDLANLIGVCVVTGNVRRSAEIALCDFDDPVFLSLKNYKEHPRRAKWGWMSNNSVVLNDDSDFENLAVIADANINGTDVGYFNSRNIPFGRIGKNDDIRPDKAIGLNPCGEIPLESREVCNVAETLPTRCVDSERWLRACEFATFYCSTVTLLPTHQPTTNRVVNRNHRIGVSIIDYTGWIHQFGVAKVTRFLREGYTTIRRINKQLADEAGIVESNRVTTIKPGGTVPKIAGRTPGAGHPTFKYTIRRIRIQGNTQLERLLQAANIPNEPDAYSKMTTCFEYPIVQGPARPAAEVSIWEQAMNLILLQREWADNAVSNTLYFKPRWSKVKCYVTVHNDELIQKLYFRMDKHSTLHSSVAVPLDELNQPFHQNKEITVFGERYKIKKGLPLESSELYRYNPQHEEDELEAVLAAIAPLTKSVSLLPHSDLGIFKQMPEEGITKEEFERRLKDIKPIDWGSFLGSDGQDEKYCEGDKCIVQ